MDASRHLHNTHKLAVGGICNMGVKERSCGMDNVLGTRDGLHSGKCALTRNGDLPLAEIQNVNPDDLVVDYAAMLGDGTYGEVFMAEFTAGKHAGKKAVVKRAKEFELAHA